MRFSFLPLRSPRISSSLTSRAPFSTSTPSSHTRWSTSGRRILHAIDTHCGGSPSRIIISGLPHIPGTTMMEKKLSLEKNYDFFRQFLLYEPRGSPIMMGNLIFPSAHPKAEYGYVIMEQTEYPPMSGHNTICVATALLESGMVEMKEPITEFGLEAPAGLVWIKAECQGGKVLSVTIKNVPSFVSCLDAVIELPEYGKVKVDVAYGGMFFVIADAEQFGLSFGPEHGGKIARVGRMLTQAASEQLTIAHPLDPNIKNVTISLLSWPPTAKNPSPKRGLSNAVTISNGNLDWKKPETWTGVLDRSPCGTGTCAKMATLYARNKLDLNEEFVHESIVGAFFTGKILEVTKVGERSAIIPSISGRAWITGHNQLVLDPSDPFPRGFTVGDIWGGSSTNMS